jgi:hypothetical protein
MNMMMLYYIDCEYACEMSFIMYDYNSEKK